MSASGFVCDEDVPVGKLEPGDLFSALPASELMEKWSSNAALPLSVRGFGKWRVDPPETVTRVRILRAHA